MANREFNPWKTIWSHPRETFSALLEDGKTERALIIISALRGILYLFPFLFLALLGRLNSPVTAFLLILVCGAAIGYIASWIGAFFLWLASRLFSSTAPINNYRVVCVWAQLPSILLDVLVLSFAFIQTLILSQAGSPPSPLVQTGLAYIELIALLTSIYFGLSILIRGLAFLDKSSKWRAVALLVVAFLIYLSIVLACFFLFQAFSAMPMMQAAPMAAPSITA